MPYELKNAQGDPTQTEPEVIKAALDEIKKVGANSKELVESVKRDFEELKAQVAKTEKEIDPLITEKISKLTEDITVKQDAIDAENAKAQKRMDDLEAAFRRSGRATSEDSDKYAAEALEFKKQKLIAEGKVKPEDVDLIQLDKDDVEQYKQYTRVLRKSFRVDDRQLSSDELKTLQVGIDPDGGYWVEPEMQSRVIMRQYELDPIRQLASSISISSDSVKMQVDFEDAVLGGWVAEQDARSQTDTPEIQQKTITVFEHFAQPAITQQLLEDANFNVMSWMMNKLADKFARTEGTAFVTGTGVGQPRGFLTYPDGDDGDIGAIEQINMGAAADLTTDGFLDVKYSLIEQYLNSGTWLMNRLTVRDAMQLKDGDGQYIWRMGMVANEPSTLLGLPVRMSTSMPTVAANSLSVALADWSRVYLVVDRLGITTLRDPYTAKPLVLFYTRKRVGGDVVNFQGIKIGKVAA